MSRLFRRMTGVKPGSNRGQTRVRPGSDPNPLVSPNPTVVGPPAKIPATSAAEAFSQTFDAGSDPGLTPV